MKALSVRYERLKNLGNFEHEKVAIEVQVEEGETAQQALDAARDFVRRSLPDQERDTNMRRALGIVRDPDNYLVRDVKWAEDFLKRSPAGNDTDDLPF